MGKLLLALPTSSLLLLPCGPVMAAPAIALQTSVAPRPDEDLAADCRYELTLLDPARTVRGVWVIFDRGRDMLRYYGDPDVEAFARRHDFALLLPFHCPAESEAAGGDMNMDPARGIGRALFAALTQFAESSRHPELAAAKLILLGFSGTGSLAGRFAAYAPDRVLAIIASHPGHNPLGVDTISLSPESAAVPQLILAGSDDAISGTERPYDYFRRHFEHGAPWTFVIQNRVPHCCVINAKALVLQWLEAVVIRLLKRDTGWYGFIKTRESDATECDKPSPPAVPIWCRGAKDAWGGSNWSVGAAKINRSPGTQDGMLPAGWLPDRKFAQQWVSFITKLEHPRASLP